MFVPNGPEHEQIKPTLSGAPDALAPVEPALVDWLPAVVELLDEDGLELDEQAAAAATMANTPTARTYR
jgi:hypothetical protein